MNWEIREQPDKEILEELHSALNIPRFICTLLIQRSIDSLKLAQAYFRPNLDELNDPFMMKDMDKSVDRLIRAIEGNEKIMILGDYAKGIDSGLIEILIVGNNINKDYLDEISPKIELKIKSKLSSVLCTVSIPFYNIFEHLFIII